jgi:predicted ribosomally synthesized peptide with nif11-like leader
MPNEQSAEQMNAFAAAVETDRALQEKLAAAASDYAAAVVAIAARAGFAITADQVQAAQLENLPPEISEDDLSGVTGGCWVARQGIFWGGHSLMASQHSR